MSRKTSNLVTGIEIGSSMIKVVMGEFDQEDSIRIAGLAEVASMRVLKGEITDNNIVHEQLVQALGQAEKQAGQDIGDVYLAVNCGSMSSVNSMGSFAATGPDKTITENDLTNALENAKAYVLPPDKKVLHTIDRRYIVDGNREVSNPVNQIGQKLSADIHMIYGQYNSIENLCLLVERTMGYSAQDACFSAVAAAFGVLSAEEKRRGTLVIDIGAGTTSYILFYGIGVFHSGQLTVGADHVANDVAIGVNTPLIKARKIVENLSEYGASAVMTPDGGERTIRVNDPGMKVRNIPASTIELIVETRLKELFDIIHDDLKRNGALSRITAGIVLVGGGALIAGVDALAGRVFNLPVRVGTPRDIRSIHDAAASPKYATAIGLLRWAEVIRSIEQNARLPVTEQIAQDIKCCFGKIRGGLRGALKW